MNKQVIKWDIENILNTNSMELQKNENSLKKSKYSGFPLCLAYFFRF